MSRILPALFLLATAQFSWAACDDSLPGTGSRNDVLIIVNDNAVDSCEVGRYYAEQRGLGRSNILHIKAPANPTISYVQYEILRNQIIRELQQRIGGTAATCSTPGDTICTVVTGQLRASSTIKYLVTTKGVPARLIHLAGENWIAYGADEAGSVDGYLRSQLGSFFYPARIDGLDLAAAKRLVDRALEAESTGWRGELLSAASKNDDAGGAVGGTRFATTGYAMDQPVPVQSEKLKAPYAGIPGDPFNVGDPVGDFLYPDSRMHWRYQFGLFGEADVACTGNTTAGVATDFYLNNSPSSLAGRAPTQCKVKLVKGNGANPAYGEPQPGVGGRMPRVVDAVAYLGHLDGQPTLAGNFNNLKNWTRDASCTARLCKDDPTDPAACRAASIDPFKELDTRCIGVADGFIGHNFQSWPLSFFTAWPTGWHPLGFPPLAGAAGFATEIGGSGNDFASYPKIRNDDGDGDSTSLWYGAHDKVATTTCYASDLTTTAPCTDLNKFQIGQQVASVGVTPITGVQYYRVSLSYRSTAGEVAAATKLSAQIVIEDDSISPRKQKPLRAKLNTAVGSYPFRDSSGDVTIGVNSGAWKRASAVFKLDPDVVLEGSTKQISGMVVNIFSNSNFSGTVGIDSIVLEKVDASDVVESALTLVNGDFSEGHNQVAVGDWAATFTSRLNGTAFWGSTTHNCGGTGIFVRLGDTLANFVRGDDLATAVWKNESCSGGLLYGDPLYSPLAVKLDAVPQRIVLGTGLPLTGNVLNGSGTGIATSYSVEYCYGLDFFTCDRTSGWHTTNIVAGPGQAQGRNIALGTLDTSAIDVQQPFTLRLTVTSTKAGKTSVNRDFSRQITGFASTANSDGDSLTDGEEVALGTDPTQADSDQDGLPDDWEVSHGFNPVVVDTAPDNDGDGLNSKQEQFLGTSDSSFDSDGDGYTDYAESIFGSEFAGNSALQPPFGAAAIPMYAGVGHPYHVTLQLQNGVTSVGPAYAMPENATLVGTVLDWTPTSDQVGWVDIILGPEETPSWFQVKVIPLDGDLNEDGAFDIGDLVLMGKIVVGEVQASQKQIFHADFYPLSEPSGVPDGKLDLSDLLQMQKQLLAAP